MKVFISWSGATSRSVAEALSSWLPKVIQGVEPFVSAKDIDKGANWTVELARELDDAEFGIVCLAPDNLLSPWLNYEAGAITKSVNSRVCPVLFEVTKEQVKPPIAQLQMTSIDIDDFLMLMGSMNKVAGSPLTSESLKEAVTVWWPLLEKEIKAIPLPKGPKVATDDVAPEPEKPDVDLAEMLSEVLHRVRNVDSRVSRIERGTRSRPLQRPSYVDEEARPSMDAGELILATRSAGFQSNSAAHGPSSIDVQVDGELPPILPHSLFVEAGAWARKNEMRVRIVGTNRTAIFEKDGSTAEDPF